MELQLRPHISAEKTPWGMISRPLNQHIVLLKNEHNGEFVQCGYVGDAAFLPLCGFPQELCEAVAAECSKQLQKPVSAGMAPPSLAEVVSFLNSGSEDDE